MDKAGSQDTPSLRALLFSPEQVKRSLIISFIVGTILNVINQGHLITTPEKINIVNLFLTFIVPYCVSTVAAAQSKASFYKQLLTTKLPDDSMNIEQDQYNELTEKVLTIVSTMVNIAGNVNKASKERLFFVTDIERKVKGTNNVMDVLSKDAQVS